MRKNLWESYVSSTQTTRENKIEEKEKKVTLQTKIETKESSSRGEKKIAANDNA